MENELYKLCLKLRALAHCMHFSSYIAEVTEDCDFELSMIELASDYLHFESDRIISQLPEYCELGTKYKKESIWGNTFKTNQTSTTDKS